MHRASHAAKIERLESRVLLSYAPGSGLAGTYFGNADFTGSTASRIDNRVDFSAAPNSLRTSVSPSTYSIRWTGHVRPAYSETYTFSMRSAGEIRLWVSHHLLIDRWRPHSIVADSAIIALSAGMKYDIQVEYANPFGNPTAELSWSSATTAPTIIPRSRLYPAAANLKDMINHAFVFAESQLTTTMAALGNNPSKFVLASSSNGAWSTVAADYWTSGYLPGAMWQVYANNPRKSWRLSATAWSRAIGPTASIPDDVSSRIFTSYIPLLSATGSATDKQVLVDAANAKMTTWDETAGVFRSSTMAANISASSTFSVIIDQSMDAQLLYWAASATGNSLYRDRATAHLLELAKYYVRADGSTIQSGSFSAITSAFLGADVKQAYSTTSTWSRGQAWAIYAFTSAYEETHSTTFLATAQKLADYWIVHVPADGVPYWDFSTPGIPNTYRDSSAAAIAASALVVLSQSATNATDRLRDRAAAEKTLSSLCSPAYLAEGSGSPGILLHGALFVPHNASVNNSLIFGDYFFLEAMNRYMAM